MSLRVATILTVLAVGAIACTRQQPQPAATPTPPIRQVATGEVARSGGAGELAVPAVVQARRRATLSARIPASVTELPYEEGQAVQAGAVVVRVDDSAVHAAAAAAEAGVQAAEADLARTKTLLEKGAATPRELEQVTAAASGARAQLTAARDNLSYTALRAPFAGRIAARRVNLGDVVNPGMPLVEIEGEGGLEIRATVESAAAARLRPGARLKAAVDGLDQPLTATVTAVSPAGDPTTHRFEVKADIPAAPGLRSGLFARLLVPGTAAEPRLTIPVDALFERGGLTGVFVVADGRARLRWVAAGARDRDTVEIRAGLESGEKVVRRPADLVDGNPVRVAAAGWPGGATQHPLDEQR
ncbi:MAG TPA: efflux RND transporter periplasmic adaptor subunit [Vicinamibacteria bacterium]|nr:efflux RND transporter periplasmic adaptor subunit [Vicinamibacteria bacterium]